jgi:ribosomal protein S18 acetylase RimI-like enzyme
VQVRRAERGELAEVAGWVASCQADPRWHIGEFGFDPDGIEEDLAGREPGGLEQVLVAVDDGEVVALLAVDWDDDPPRAWWAGPIVDDPRHLEVGAAADLLLAAGQDLLPHHVTQQEFAFDDRASELGAFAQRHGAVAEEASAVLNRPLADAADLVAAAAGTGDGVEVVDPDTGQREAAAALHDRLFPGTHSVGTRAVGVADDRLVRVAVLDDEVVGYVALERQADGDGYLDFVGVSDAVRGRGIGRRLVAAGCLALHVAHGCPAVHLTVRESNVAARQVYVALGFTEERLLRPWRIGFGIDGT